jgi:hypothetical protein
MSGKPIPLLARETAVTEQNLPHSIHCPPDYTRLGLPNCPLRILFFLRNPARLSVQYTSGRPSNRDFAVQQRDAPSLLPNVGRDGRRSARTSFFKRLASAHSAAVKAAEIRPGGSTRLNNDCAAEETAQPRRSQADHRRPLPFHRIQPPFCNPPNAPVRQNSVPESAPIVGRRFSRAPARPGIRRPEPHDRTE